MATDEHDTLIQQCEQIESTLRVQDAPEVVREDAEGKPSMIEIVRPTATELWASLESFLNSLHKGVCGQDSPEGLDHAQFVVMALRPMIAAAKPLSPDSRMDDSDDPPTCERCDDEYALRQGMDVSKYCDPCAQERVSELEPMLKKIRDFIEFGPFYGEDATNIVIEADAILGNAALSLARPEGEAKVTWRVCTDWDLDGETKTIILPNVPSESTAREIFADDFDEEDIEKRLVKIETYETVVDTRKKEA